jgi:hypothetical protein
MTPDVVRIRRAMGEGRASQVADRAAAQLTGLECLQAALCLLDQGAAPLALLGEIAGLIDDRTCCGPDDEPCAMCRAQGAA